MLLPLLACSGRLEFAAPLHAKPANINGRVHGGQQPVSGALIQLYAAGTTGDGSGATPLVSTPVYTDGSGSFLLNGLYSCPSSSSLVYLLSSGGNPGLPSGTNNSAIELMAALGPCGDITDSTSVVINEESTVAAVAMLAPYMRSATTIGSGSADANALAAAFASVNAFVNQASGLSPGPSIPSGYSVPTTKVNALADVIAACVNSEGGVAGDNSVCGRLFSFATSPSLASPTDTIAATLAIEQNPARNVSSIFDLLLPASPFEPVIVSSPSDWQLSLLPALSPPTISPGTGLYSAAQNVALTESFPSATIHYTTDGTTPSSASTQYNQPFAVTGTSVVNAIAVVNGFSSAVASATITIGVPGLATKLSFANQAVAAVVGSAISPGLQVAVQDVAGNLVTGGSYAVTLTLASNPGNSPLTGTLTANSVNGIATLNNVYIDRPGSGYTLQAAVQGLSSATSNAFTVAGLNNAAASNYWLHPGSPESPFNAPLTVSTQFSAVPASFGALQIDLSSWFTQPSSPGLWQAAATDPQVPVLFNINSYDNIASGIWKRQNNSASVEAQILASSSTTYQLAPTYGLYSKYYYMTTSMAGSGWVAPSPPALNPQAATPAGGLTVYAPANALPASDSDGYFAIFQPDGTVLECYSGIVLSSGTLVCGTYTITHSWSALLGSEGGIMASVVPVYAGLIRQADIDSGTIAHALSICISSTQLTTSFQSPAFSFDRSPGYTGSLPMGTRLAIPPTVNLSTHAFQSRVGAMIARAAQSYGTFLLDRGGPNGFTIRAEKNMTDPAFTNAWDWNTQQDLNWILTQLRIVQ